MMLRILVRAPLLMIGSLVMAVMTSPDISFILFIIIPVMIGAILLIIQKTFPLFCKVQKKLYTGAARFAALILPLVIFLIDTAIINYVIQLLISVMLVGRLFIRLSQGEASAQRIQEILDEQPDICPAPVTKKMKKAAGELEFRNVSFTYDHLEEPQCVLSDISFTLQPGQTMDLVGPTGSGKTTLIHLIPRFYDIHAGEILFNGIDIRELDLHDLRKRISMTQKSMRNLRQELFSKLHTLDIRYFATHTHGELMSRLTNDIQNMSNAMSQGVAQCITSILSVTGVTVMMFVRKMLGIVLQDTFLFSGTVKENIRYGNLDATDEEIYRAARIADADSFIRHLPGGYDTHLSEEGNNVSEGQKQLLSICRVILTDPSILILDEATSSVDTHTEKEIQRGMLHLMKGRTSFIIAHRLSTIRNADCILIMDKGHIIEQGTHEELLNSHGFYADLFNRTIDS